MSKKKYLINGIKFIIYDVNKNINVPIINLDSATAVKEILCKVKNLAEGP